MTVPLNKLQKVKDANNSEKCCESVQAVEKSEDYRIKLRNETEETFNKNGGRFKKTVKKT
jgi:hypothetical protein